MRNRNLIIVALLLSLHLVRFPAYSEDSQFNTPFISKGNGPEFYIDYSNFQGVDHQTYTELYIQIAYHELQFIKHNGNFQAGYELYLTVSDENENLLEEYSNADVFEVDSYAETQSTTKARVSLIAYTFDPGKYKVRAVLTDMETQHSSRIEQVFCSRSFQSPNLMISDLQLSQKIVPAEEGQPYVKNQRYIEPNATRIFTQGLSDIHVYFEIYNLSYSQNKENTTYTAYFTFYDKNGKRTTHFQTFENKPGPSSAHSLKVPVKHFRGGTYTLTIRVRDDDTGETTEASKSFTVFDSRLSLNNI
ncbi:MAG: hypothetical protein ACE5IW_03235 [bacterium]